VPWVSYWTVAPPPDVAPGAAGLDAGKFAAAKIAAASPRKLQGGKDAVSFGLPIFMAASQGNGFPVPRKRHAPRLHGARVFGGLPTSAVGGT